MKTRALIFDVDSTLVDTEELHRRAFNQVFMNYNLDWEWTPGLYTDLLHYSGGVDRLFAYVQRSGMTASEKAYLTEIVPMLHREKTQIYTELVHGTAVRARTGAARLIAEALDFDLKVALVATSAFGDVRGLAQATLGEKIASALDPIVCVDHVAHKKPAPDLYRLAVNQLRIPAEACVAFEDSANGLAAARQASLFTIVTPSRWTASQDFQGADLMLSTLGDIDAPLPAAESALIGGRPCLTLSAIEDLRRGVTAGAAGTAVSRAMPRTRRNLADVEPDDG
jgi:HAD superfamily hydrolase (TIGR01509 family)